MMAKDAGARCSRRREPERRRRFDSHGCRRSPTRSIPERRATSTSSRRTLVSIRPPAKSYVDYDFSLDSGDYKTTYDFTDYRQQQARSGPPHNPENSTVSTPFYSEHLLARWIADELRLKKGNAPNADILDGDKAQVSRGCGRYEGTFSRGGGGFIANKSGPVRAIRSYIGANSGTYTQRDDIFYERQQDTITYLRVHAGIAQISQFLDYSANAIGMTYRNSAYPAGVTIDGVPDAGIPTPAGHDLQPRPTGSRSPARRGRCRPSPGSTPTSRASGRLVLPRLGTGRSTTSVSARATPTDSPTELAATSTRAAGRTPTRRSMPDIAYGHYDLTSLSIDLLRQTQCRLGRPAHCDRLRSTARWPSRPRRRASPTRRC